MVSMVLRVARLGTNSIPRASEAAFNFNESTGEFSFVVAPDFENSLDGNGDNIYTVTVTAISTADFTTAPAESEIRLQTTINLEVTDVNETPTIVDQSFSAPENSTFVGVVTSNDQEEDQVYSIAEGGDGSLFTIDPITGELSFVTAPDFESGNNTFSLTVEVKDEEERLPIQSNVAVTVTDVDEAPSIEDQSFSTPENSTFVGFVSSNDPEGNQVYSIADGGDASLFTIDPEYRRTVICEPTRFREW